MDGKTFAKNVASGAIRVGSFYFFSALTEFYGLSDIMHKSEMPLIGIGGSLTFFCATEDEGKRFRHPLFGIGLGMIPNVVSSAYRWSYQLSQYAPSSLQNQHPASRFLENIILSGITLTAIYGLTAVISDEIKSYTTKRRKFKDKLNDTSGPHA